MHLRETLSVLGPHAHVYGHRRERTLDKPTVIFPSPRIPDFRRMASSSRVICPEPSKSKQSKAVPALSMTLWYPFEDTRANPARNSSPLITVARGPFFSASYQPETIDEKYLHGVELRQHLPKAAHSGKSRPRPAAAVRWRELRVERSIRTDWNQAIAIRRISSHLRRS